MPAPTDLHATTSVRYSSSGAYEHDVYLTWTLPRGARDVVGDLSPIRCGVARAEGGGWVTADDITFCEAGEVSFVGRSTVFRVEPGSTQVYAVFLLHGVGGSEPWRHSSPLSNPVTVTVPEAGVPNLRSTCTLDFGATRSYSAVPLRLIVDPTGVAIDAFEIERSEDGADRGFAFLMSVSATGEISYHFEDTALTSGGTYYYRARSRFADGTLSGWSNVIKERAVPDDTWCDTDRQVQDRDATPFVAECDGLTESCDGVDEDCDGRVDEGLICGGVDGGASPSDAAMDADGGALDAGPPVTVGIDKGCGCRVVARQRSGSTTPLVTSVSVALLLGARRRRRRRARR